MKCNIKFYKFVQSLRRFSGGFIKVVKTISFINVLAKCVDPDEASCSFAESVFGSLPVVPSECRWRGHSQLACANGPASRVGQRKSDLETAGQNVTGSGIMRTMVSVSQACIAQSKDDYQTANMDASVK